MAAEAVRLDTGRGRWIVVAMALGSGMVFLDSTVVNVALPRIQSDLAASLSGLQWVVNAYTLTLASFLLVGGDLGDTLGRKRLIEGPALGWDSPSVLGTLGLGIVGLVLFPFREMRAARPMVPLTIFGSRNFSGANLVSLAVYFAFGGALLFLTLDLQQVRGYSALAAGLATLPITLLLLLLSPRMGSLVNRFGSRAFMTLGPVVNALGLLWLLTTDRASGYLTGFLPGIILLGLGMSVFVTPLTATVMAALPDTMSGIASGVNNAVTRVASLLAIAILGVIIAARFDQTLPAKLGHTSLSGRTRQVLIAREGRLAADPVPAALSASERSQARLAIDESFVDGFHWVVGTCALLCLAGGAVSWLTIRTENA